MLESESINEIADILKPEMFYKDCNQKIFIVIISMFDKSKSIDILTVTEELKNRGQLEEIGGALYITQLTSKVSSSCTYYISFSNHIPEICLS